MKRFAKVYLEISNACNLNCSFCPGTTRVRRFMTEQEFAHCLEQLRGYTDYLYFHLMGEPLLHPKLEQFLDMAGVQGFHVVLTTNGTMLPQHQKQLLETASLHKINISLHSFEANDIPMSFDEYLRGCVEFGVRSGEKIVCYRLWNEGGSNKRNEEIEVFLHRYFPEKWERERNGIRIGHKVFLQYDRRFDWPAPDAEDHGEEGFCYGLRDQIGVLCDGTVVPCCLDGNGAISLGNLFEEKLETVLRSDRAQNIYRGFSCRKAVEPLCRRCGYAQRFR